MPEKCRNGHEGAASIVTTRHLRTSFLLFLSCTLATSGLAAPAIELTTQRASREIERNYGEVIRGRTRGFVQCEIADIRATRRKGASDVTIKFNVSPEGKVSQPKIMLNSVGSSGLASCLISYLSQIQFPPPGENPVFVTYPFQFNRTPIGPRPTRRVTTFQRPTRQKKLNTPVARRGTKKSPARSAKKPTKRVQKSVKKKQTPARKPATKKSTPARKPATKKSTPARKPASAANKMAVKKIAVKKSEPKKPAPKKLPAKTSTPKKATK